MTSASNASTSAKRKIYVVDDDSMVRQSLFFSLTTAGYEVRPFASGNDLLDEIDNLDPGCILLDLRMPEKDGAEVLREIGTRTRCFPVVIITGHGEIDLAVRTMKLGASDFVEKPFGEQQLLEILMPLFEALPGNVEKEEKRSHAVSVIGRLSKREYDILQGLVSGLSNKDAALQIGISIRTVEVHRANLMRALGVKSVGEAVRLALLGGLIPD